MSSLIFSFGKKLSVLYYIILLLFPLNDLPSWITKKYLGIWIVSGEPIPVMSSISEPGVYSLFPDEDLRTGKKLGFLPEQRRSQDQQIFRSSSYSSDRNYRGPSRIIFDDDRLNQRVHFDTFSRARIPLTSSIEAEEIRRRPIIDYHSSRREHPTVILPYPPVSDTNLPHTGSDESIPTRVHVFSPDISAFRLPNLPFSTTQEETSEDIPTGSGIIHVDPPTELNSVLPGQLLLPGFNAPSTYFNLKPPGPDTFLNHDQLLNYHTKAVISSSFSNTKKPNINLKNKKIEPCRLLFSSSPSSIHDGLKLVPPSSSSPNLRISSLAYSTSPRNEGITSSTESFEGQSNEGNDQLFLQHLPSSGSALLKIEAIKNPTTESGFISFSSTIPYSSSSSSSEKGTNEEELGSTLSRTKIPSSIQNSQSSINLYKNEHKNGKRIGIVESFGTEVPTFDTIDDPPTKTTTMKTTTPTLLTSTTKESIIKKIKNTSTKEYPYVKKSSFHTRPAIINRVSHHTLSTLSTASTRPFSRSRTNSFYNNGRYFSTATNPTIENITEEITFPPNVFSDYEEHGRTASHFSTSKIQTENPFISTESSTIERTSTEENLGIQQSYQNNVFVERIKNPDDMLRISGKNPTHIQSTMRIIDAIEGKTTGSTQSPKNQLKFHHSTSTSGLVSKIHAHVSHCPKLYKPTEIICDIHIRKRHGSLNPRLTVGWKRKFHNATREDVVLAVNTTLAYIEKNFHDKFNVTLAPGTNPMLRSVLSISQVEPSDTGNYECQVEAEGQNKLRSDTLLFLCH